MFICGSIWLVVIAKPGGSFDARILKKGKPRRRRRGRRRRKKMKKMKKTMKKTKLMVKKEGRGEKRLSQGAVAAVAVVADYLWVDHFLYV